MNVPCSLFSPLKGRYNNFYLIQNVLFAWIRHWSFLQAKAHRGGYAWAWQTKRIFGDVSSWRF